MIEVMLGCMVLDNSPGTKTGLYWGTLTRSLLKSTGFLTVNCYFLTIVANLQMGQNYTQAIDCLTIIQVFLKISDKLVKKLIKFYIS